MLTVQAFTFNPIQENTYLVFNEFGHCMIIDPGCYFDDEKDTLRSFITNNNLQPVALVNTHCHLDHVFGNQFVSTTYGLSLQINRKEKLVLEYAPTSGLMYNLPFDQYYGELVYLAEGEQCLVGSDVLSLIEVPGHSPGSLCFYCAAQGFLIGGDVLFQRSIGRTDLPLGDHDTLISSIRDKLFTLPDGVIVYPGHGPATTIGEEKRENPFFR